MSNNKKEVTSTTANYTELNTNNISKDVSCRRVYVKEGDHFIASLLDHMADSSDDYVPAIVSDAVAYAFAYAEEHPVCFLSSIHYRPFFTKKDSLWADYSSFTIVKDRFQAYAEETKRDVTELLAYLDAIMIMCINSVSEERTEEETKEEISKIRQIALDLFCILDN